MGWKCKNLSNIILKDSEYSKGKWLEWAKTTKYEKQN